MLFDLNAELRGKQRVVVGLMSGHQIKQLCSLVANGITVLKYHRRSE
jgi:hypothetical protein